MINKEKIKFAQKELKKLNLYKGSIDGLMGRKTRKAIYDYSKKIKTWWPSQKALIGFIQAYAEQNEIDSGPIDGILGKMTSEAYKKLRNKLKYKEEEYVTKPILQNNIWPYDNQKELFAYFGDIGSNQVRFTSPFELILDWDHTKTINSFYCHKKVKPYFENIFEDILSHYGIDGIKELKINHYGGCLNIRPITGGSKWSTHAWGISIDLYPSQNRLYWGREEAVFAQKEYQYLHEAFYKQGFTNLGLEKDFDYMHFQAAIRK